MSTVPKIAVVGFLEEDEKKIRQMAATAALDNVEWCSAKDGGLTGVIFNAKFVQTPSIQKFISITKANVACCYKNIVDLVEAKALDLPALSLEATDPTEIKTWFDAITFIDESKAQAAASQMAREQAAARQQYDTKVLSSVLELIRTRSGYLVAESNVGITWVDPMQQEAFMDYTRDQILPVESMDWREVSSFNPPEGFRRMQLDLWLFEAIWNSTEDYESLISSTQRYRMSRWPQPLKKEGRTEALKLAASLLSQPMNASELAAATDYPLPMVNRFLYAGFAAGQIKQVASSEIAPKVAPVKKELTEQEKRKNEEKLSIIARLRKRFGFGN